MNHSKTFYERFAELGVGLMHHFGGGVYAKETLIPAGVKLLQHVHEFDHLSILASGRVHVRIDGGEPVGYEGPACITIAAGRAHEVEAVTPATWFCIHATKETDPAKVDRAVLG
jgi:quercetin dioxygenase-like cupin family protein